MRRRRLPPPDADRLARAAATLSVGNAEQLQAALGRGDVPGPVMRALYPELSRRRTSSRPSPPRSAASSSGCGSGAGIHIQGVDGLMVRYAQCCQPVPGDPVVGYVTQGRGISIHRGDCPNLLPLSTEAERRVEIDWQESEGETFVVRLVIAGRTGAVCTPTSARRSPSRRRTSGPPSSRPAMGRCMRRLLVEVENQTHLNKVIRAIRKVKGVTEVERRDVGTHQTQA